MANGILSNIRLDIESKRKQFERYRSTYKDSSIRTLGRSNEDLAKEALNALRANPWDKTAFEVLASVALKTGDYALAAYGFEELASLGKSDTKTTRNLGVSYYRLGKAAEQNKEYALARDYLNKTKTTLGKCDASKDPEVSEILKNIDIELRTILSESSQDLGGLEKIQGESTRLDRQDHGEINLGELESELSDPKLDAQKRVAAARSISNYMSRNGQYNRAIEYLQKAQKIADNSDIRKDIAQIKLKIIGDNPKKEDLEAIKSEYSSLAKDRQNDAEVIITLGKINSQLGNWEECLAALQRVQISEQGKKEELELLIGEALLGIQQPLAAAKQFSNISKEAKGTMYVAAMYGLGKAQEEMKKRDNAIDSFSEVIRLDINHKDALKRLEALKKTKDQ